jgi:hypothetical protein
VTASQSSSSGDGLSFGDSAKLFSRMLGGPGDIEDSELAELKLELQIAQNRRSPPRCLTCGGTQTIDVDYGADDVSTNFVHDCGGRLRRIAPNPDATRFHFRTQVMELDAAAVYELPPSH